MNLVWAAILALLTPGLASAGGMDGGGGQGILCGETGGEQTLRSLDLYEAEHVWGYPMPKTGTLEEEAVRTFANTSIYSAYDASQGGGLRIPAPEERIRFVTARYNDFVGNLQFIPAGARLPLSNDTGKLLIEPPPQCRLVQVLFFADEDVDSGRILADREYWDLLNPQDRLAFMHHENIYKSIRAFSGVRESSAVRKVIGLIFSDREFPGLIRQTFPLKSLQYCYTEQADLSFFVVPFDPSVQGRKDKLARLVFQRIGEIPLMVETTFDTLWSYDRWVAGKSFQSSGVTSWTRSALGSYKAAVGFADNNRCLRDGSRCRPTLKVQLPGEGWVGGDLVCRKFR